MGKLIVIDGLDGCGKATQSKIIEQDLINKGYKVKRIDFPKYESDSSALVRMYLNGEFGGKPECVNPYTASLFYSVDRAAQFLKEIQSYYDDGYTLIADRYTSANIIYQGTKFDTDDERKNYFKWMYDIEINKMGLPKEDITIVLTLPVEVSQTLMTRRYEGHEEKKDIHEADVEFLKRVKNNASVACEYLSSIGYNWVEVDCSDGNGNIRSIDDINVQLTNILKGIGVLK